MGAKQRLKEYLKFHKIGIREFARDTGLSHGILNSGDNLGTDKVEIIIGVYADLNLLWLITGKGKMILEKQSENTEISNMSIKSLFEQFMENSLMGVNDNIEQILEQNTEILKYVDNQYIKGHISREKEMLKENIIEDNKTPKLKQ